MGGYSESSGSLNVITRVLIRKKGGRRLRTRGDVIKGSRDQSAVGPLAKECRWPLEAGKGKETDSPLKEMNSPLELLERNSPADENLSVS